MIQSVSRAFIILRAVANHPEGIGVSDIARSMNVHKSTVSRLIATLESENAIERLPEGGGFRIGNGIVALLPELDRHQQLASIAAPFLRTLSNATGESSSFNIVDNQTSLTIAQVNGNHSLSVRDHTGERFPLHVASSGKHFLAYWPDNKLQAYVARPLQTYTAATIKQKQVLLERLRQVRHDGYDWTVGEFEEGLTAVSAPVFDKVGNILGAFAVTGPSFRFPQSNKRESITTLLLDVCEEAADTFHRWGMQLNGDRPVAI